MMTDYDDIIRQWRTSINSQTDMTERNLMDKMKKGCTS